MVILSIDKTLQFLQKLRIENRNKCKEFYILLLNSLLGIVKDSSEKFGIFSNRICMSVIVEKHVKILYQYCILYQMLAAFVFARLTATIFIQVSFINHMLSWTGEYPR